MLRFGLIGKHISYSKSPGIHQVLAQHVDVDMTYDLLDVDDNHLSLLINQLKTHDYDGFNVTQPYKQKIISYIDVLTPKAKRLNAVNTIYLKDGLVVGDNTDYDGFLGLLKRNHIDLKDKVVYILGTGGAAKAVYYVLCDLNIDSYYVTRDPLKVNEKTITYDTLYQKYADVVIQTTPVGTYPNINESMLNKEYVKDKIVIDLIYNPIKTQILKDAKSGVNGLDMLMLQAIKSFTIWTNKNIELNDTLYQKLKEVITHE
jgi:shikimate dehydrogenase